ncbi:MAG: lipase maturation factor family protein [Verrucomicrobia bacterium]|nr:lipase maturation factor family protein [Verrucomicrobiota bacterium]
MPTPVTDAPRRIVSIPPAKPTLVYDGDCGFCRRCVERLRKFTGPRIDYRASQELHGDFAEIPNSDFETAVQFIALSGQVSSAAEAIVECLRTSWLRALPARLYGFRPFAAICEFLYRAIARHRSHLSRAALLLFGKQPGPSRYLFSRWLFIRALAGIFLIAFMSLWVQIDGLIGSQVILPAVEIIAHLRGSGTENAALKWPTLLWLSPSDAMLHGMCAAGSILSAMLLVTGCLPGLVLTLLVMLYLSLATAGQIFLGYQWDILLLETGFLAIFLAPLHLRLTRRSGTPPSRIAIFLMHWLIFRLMFRSGLVKLASNDDVWWNLSALKHHYWTQPLPTLPAWYMHQLPMGFQKSSVALTFAIELAVPFLFFAPRRLRQCGALATMFLMLVIMLTGNYTFFNWLTIALCILLLDDSVWPSRLRGNDPLASTAPARRKPLTLVWAGRAVLLALSTAWLIMTVPQTWQTVQQTVYLRHARRAAHLPEPERQKWMPARVRPKPVGALSARMNDAVAPFRVVGQYGLFANMTENRPEIIVEGSDDGIAWHAYAFKWKPGDVLRAPAFVAPHQPRLDWQMWFAALGDPQYVHWFPPFLKALLENRPAVIRLLDQNPFPEHPPRYVRARLFEYTFTDMKTHRETGAWWSREARGNYIPIEKISLQNFEPRPGPEARRRD